MGLDYVFFLSHQSARHDLMKTFTSEFCSALETETVRRAKRDKQVIRDKPIYQVQPRLLPGYDEKESAEIASALCSSACMIAVYTPVYFDADQECAREFAAMQALEKHRKQFLKKGDGTLIIPVVLRGYSTRPKPIQDRKCFNFESYNLGGRKISRDPNYSEKIRDIVKYGVQRYSELSGMPGVVSDCSDFRLPARDDSSVVALLTRP